MTTKSKNITGWVLTGILAFVFASSAFMKLTGSDEVVKGAASMGLTPGAMQVIGMIEVLSLVLFIIPRTGLLGTLLLAAYLGGAIVTHLEHGQPFIMPVVIQAIVWITAVVRFPELSRRLLQKAAV